MAYTTEQQEFQKKEAFTGIELVPDTHRLALMNAMLHGIEGRILQADALSTEGKQFKDYDVILTNPPFGTKRGGERPTRDDLTYPTSNKQLNFLQMIYRSLRHQRQGPGRRGPARQCALCRWRRPEDPGRPDGQVRPPHDPAPADRHLLRPGRQDERPLFHPGQKDKGNTKDVWIYDMRSNMPSFGKRTPLTTEHFQEFHEGLWG